MTVEWQCQPTVNSRRRCSILTPVSSRVLPVAALLLLVAPIAIVESGFRRTVARPKILGVAHIALFVSDLDKTRAFYRDLLGYEEPFTLPKSDGSVQIAFIKINDRQWIELFNEPTAGEGQLNHIAFYTDNAEGMRSYLASRQVKVPASVGKGRIGNKNFTVKDPDGHTVEIVEYQRDGWTMKDDGKHMPASRLSQHAMHVGVLVGDLNAANAFYHDILGFTEFWRGSAANSKTLSWVNMRVPNGTDYVEFMLYNQLPAPDSRGTQHHLCLVVPDVDKAVAAFDARPSRATYTSPVGVRTGINRKRQVNLFDPDGTRIELMEPETIDGKPAPSSTLPPPRTEPRR
jgi:catechol 2,3-dioxygenase-like lactoylglutathione lyase family enzyme